MTSGRRYGKQFCSCYSVWNALSAVTTISSLVARLLPDVSRVCGCSLGTRLTVTHEDAIMCFYACLHEQVMVRTLLSQCS